MCKQSGTGSSFTASHQQADLQQLQGKLHRVALGKTHTTAPNIPPAFLLFPPTFIAERDILWSAIPLITWGHPSPPRAHPQPPHCMDRGGMRESLKRISAPEALCLSQIRGTAPQGLPERKLHPSQAQHIFIGKKTSAYG